MVPIAIPVNWVLDRVPWVKDVDADPDGIEKKLGPTFGDPMIMGFFIGIALGLIAYWSEFAGNFWGTVDFNPGSGTANLTSVTSSSDAFIAKYNSSGGYTWAKRIGGSGVEWINAIDTDSSGNVYVFGYFQGTVDFNPGSGSHGRANGDTPAFVHPDAGRHADRAANTHPDAGKLPG